MIKVGDDEWIFGGFRPIRRMKPKKFYQTHGSGGGSNYGLLSYLLAQGTNGSTNVKAKLAYPDWSGVGVWSVGTNYSKSDRVQWPSTSSPLVWRASVDISSGGLNPTLNSNWQLISGIDFIQDSGDATNFFRYKISWNKDEFLRIMGIDYGTVSETNFEWTYSSLINGWIGTSVSSIAIPTSHPTSRTFTTQAGLNLVNGATLTIKGGSNQYFLGTITAYDNGTGVTTVSSTLNVGSGTLSSWKIYNYRMPGFGNSTLPSGSNSFSTTNNGEVMMGEFTTGALFFRHGTSAGGKDWLFHYTGGPNIANPPADVSISCYNPAGAVAVDLVWRDLLTGTHTFTATVVNATNGSSSNTTAFYHLSSDTSISMTFSHRYHFDQFTVTQQITGASDSFGEFAYQVKKNGTGDTPAWFPDHNSALTGVSSSRVYTVNGVVVNAPVTNPDTNPYLYKYQTVTNVVLTQTGQFNHPTSGAACTFACTHTVTRTGILYDLTLTWLDTMLIATGYNNMVFVNEGWFDKMKTAGGEYVADPADGVPVNLSATQKNQDSYLFYSTDGSAPEKDLVLSQYWPLAVANWRVGLSNLGTPFIQNFSGANAGSKLYPYVFNNYVTSISEVMNIKGMIYLGKITDANSNL